MREENPFTHISFCFVLVKEEKEKVKVRSLGIISPEVWTKKLSFFFNDYKFISNWNFQLPKILSTKINLALIEN